jgi:hypothetical protein
MHGGEKQEVGKMGSWEKKRISNIEQGTPNIEVWKPGTPIKNLLVIALPSGGNKSGGN